METLETLKNSGLFDDEQKNAVKKQILEGIQDRIMYDLKYAHATKKQQEALDKLRIEKHAAIEADFVKHMPVVSDTLVRD